MPHLRRPLYSRVTPTPDESRGFYHPPVVLGVRVGRRTIRLSSAAGDSDFVDVARYGEYIMVCSYNPRMPYFGCEVFDLQGQFVVAILCSGGEECAECFGQSPDKATWPEWSWSTLFSRLRGCALEQIQ